MAQNIRSTPNGYSADSVKSAMQKAIRRGQEYEAFWWAHELGIDRRMTLVWRRLSIIACEDIGMGNPNAVAIVNACRETWDIVNGKADPKDWEWNILAHAIIVLCRSSKSRSADDLSHLVWLRKEGRDPRTRQPGEAKPERLTVPEHALDIHTQSGKKRLTIEARKAGKDADAHMTDFFREVGARMANPIRDVALDGTNWTEEVYRLKGLDPDTAFDPVDATAVSKSKK